MSKHRDAEVMRLAREWATPEHDSHDPLDCPREEVEPGTICMECALAVLADALLDRDRQLRDLRAAAQELSRAYQHSEPDAAAVVLEAALAASDPET